MRPYMNRRSFVKSVVGASVAPLLMSKAAASSPFLPNEPHPVVQTYLTPFDYNGVCLLDGMLKKEYQATRDYFFNLPNDDLMLGFRKRAGLPAPGKPMGGWYSHDIGNALGQWLSAMARMYKATGDQPILDKATYLMREWAKCIEPDGYFYYSRKPFPLTYTYDKTVCGLVDLYHYAGLKEALPHLEKITDWAMRNLDRSCPNPSPEHPDAGSGPPFNEANRLRPLEWYTLSENLYRAYEFTGNKKYKTFGDVWRYPHYWYMFTRNAQTALYGRHGHGPLNSIMPTPNVAITPYGLHAYSHVNTLSSAAMTYLVSGDPEYLKVIVNAYEWLDKTQFYATGGYGPNERLVPPDGSLGNSLETSHATFETGCGSWAAFKLGKYLMQFTGEARYGDWIEKIVYNGIGAALPMSNVPRRGETFYYSDYSIGAGSKFFFPDAFPCCAGTQPQNLVDYHDLIYFKDPTSLCVNLFVPSQVTWDLEGNEIKVEQLTSYPESETVTLHVNPARSTVFNLKIRVPGWCEGFTVEVNGSKQGVVARPGAWAVLKRKWSSGDLVKVTVPMRPRLVPVDKQHQNRVAVVVGPVVLVRENEGTLAMEDRDPSKWMHSSGEPLEYRISSQQTPLFVPFYRVGQSAPYGMYFDLRT